MIRRVFSPNSLFATTLVTALVGCGGTETETPTSVSPTTAETAPAAAGAPEAKAAGGTVAVDGSSTVFRISRAAQLGFQKQNPNVKVLVGNHGTGGGFSRYLEGEVDVVDASRAAKPEEESKAQEKKLDWTRFLVGYDGITVVVNPANTFVKSLTVDQLKKLFEPDSKVNAWKELDPSWPDKKISLYTPDNDSGTFEFFTEAVVKKTKSQRKDVQASPDDKILVTGVAGDPDGLGYFGYAYYAESKDKLRALPIQNGPEAKPVEPNPETILAKTYAPLSRPLYIYVKSSALARPEVAEFVTYYIENGEKLARLAKYVPPTAEDLAANRQALAATKK